MSEVLTSVVRPVGRALGAGFGAAAAVRGTKPLHPRGSVVDGTIERHGSSRRRGVAWLDEPGSHRCRVRFSRSLGLPDWLPDVQGLAVQFRDGDGVHDLALASSGTAPVMRHLLLPRRARTTTYGSVFTYASPQGPLVLAALPQAEGRSYVVAVARPFGDWDPFAVLHLDALPDAETDGPMDVDPVEHALPGLAMSAPLAALRRPSYASARQHRSQRPQGTATGCP